MTLTGVDILGAEGLKTQYVVLRVKDIDIAKLRKGAGKHGELAAVGVGIANLAPQLALKVAAPFAAKMLKDDYGVDTDITIADAPPPPQHSRSEFVIGAAAGAGAVGVLVGVGYAISRIVRHFHR